MPPRLRAERIVVDAARYRTQQDLIASLRASGAEIVLDTNAAELASPAGRREREARALVKSGRKPARFRCVRATLKDIVGAIA